MNSTFSAVFVYVYARRRSQSDYMELGKTDSQAAKGVDEGQRLVN
jgi:hypothetical protein